MFLETAARPIRHVISFSTGKDSTATLLLARQKVSSGEVVVIFCDTGNEHQEVHDYLLYVEQTLGIKIIRLKADFSEQIAAKRKFIAMDQRTKRKYDTEPVFDAHGKPVQKCDKFGSPVCNGPIDEEIRPKGFKAFDITSIDGLVTPHALPTNDGIALVNEIKLKFNSHISLQFFCTKLCFAAGKSSFPKAEVEKWIAGWMQDSKGTPFRFVCPSNLSSCPDFSGFLHRNKRAVIAFFEYRTAKKVFLFHRVNGLKPNPLYRRGMTRVGCMPCINASKDELRQIHIRFPDHLKEKSEWELKVSLASKRGFSTFFNKELHENKKTDRRVHEANRIENVIAWSYTKRGGRELDDVMRGIEPSACSSVYGLCD